VITGDIYNSLRIYPDRIRGFFQTHARRRALYRVSGKFWRGVLSLADSQDTHTDFEAKYVKGRGSAQGCAFLGITKTKVNTYRPILFPRTPPFWVPISTEFVKIFAKNCFDWCHTCDCIAQLHCATKIATYNCKCCSCNQSKQNFSRKPINSSFCRCAVKSENVTKITRSLQKRENFNHNICENDHGSRVWRMRKQLRGLSHGARNYFDG